MMQSEVRAAMRGASFIELMFAMAIVGIATMVQVQQVTISLREHSTDLDTQFAFRRASGMLAELQASVDQGTIGTPAELDALADSDPSAFLTTRAVPAPDHVMSGNSRLPTGSWRWLRAIDIEAIEGSERSRYARIRVLRVSDQGNTTVTAVASGILSVTVRAQPVVQEYDVYVLAIAEAPSLWQPLPALRAQLHSVANAIAGANPNLRFKLHWISKFGYGRDPLYTPYVNTSTSADAAAPWVYGYPGKLAPGAAFSTLYSAEMISGRVRTEAGVLHDFAAGDNPFPHAIADRCNHCVRTPEAEALFQLRVEAGLERADEPPLQLLLADMTTNPARYKNAIFVNLHGEGLPFPPLRNYADAAKDPVGRPGVRVVTHPTRLHSKRSARPIVECVQGLAADLQAAAATLSLADKTKLETAVPLVNSTATVLAQPSPDFTTAYDLLYKVADLVEDVAGEGCALAYALNLRVRDLTADCAAKAGLAGAPEFKVYAYKTDPNCGPVVLREPITVQIMGVDLSANVNGVRSGVPTTLEIRRVVGGVDDEDGEIDDDCEYEHFFEDDGLPPQPGSSAKPYEMRYEVGYATTPQPHTWIRLYNTPLVTPQVECEGLPPGQRLFGLEYIPSPVGAMGASLDVDGGGPKNTARWRIRLAAAALPSSDTLLTVHTRLGSDVTTGRAWPTPHQPWNVSTTYAWWTDSAQDVPLTERYQFLGDPRHSPYEDTAAGGASFPHGYNWWFDDLRNGVADVTGDWPCLDGARLRDGFGRGVVEDVPRIAQVWRQALQACNAVFVNPHGQLAGTLLLGGEIVLPDAPVLVHGALYGSDGVLAVDDVRAQGMFDMQLAAPAAEPDLGVLRGGLGSGRPVVRASCGFVGKPWLGELAPDAAAVGYGTDGNLPTAGGYVRTLRSLLQSAELPRGTSWAYPSGSELDDLGGASLLQSGGAGASFMQTRAALTATLSDEVHAFTAAVGLPTAKTAAADLLLTMNGMPSLPLEQRSYPDLFPDQRALLLTAFAQGCNVEDITTGVVRVSPPGQDTNAAFFVPAGDCPSTDAEHNATTFKALALGLRALFVAGEPTQPLPQAMLPVTTIVVPTPQEVLRQPTAVELRWETTFCRFDGQPYTSAYGQGTSGSEAGLVYVVTTKRMGAAEWYYGQDGSKAEPGVWPEAPEYRLVDTGLGRESYLLALPTARFAAGEYVLRVDCFHRDSAMHAAHHEVYVEIKR